MERAINLAKNMNTLINYQSLAIPVLNDFIVVQRNLTDPNHKVIFVAIKNNTIEQFLGDGVLGEKESVDDRIEKIINEIKEEVKDNELYKENDEYLCYYKDYDNDNFDFKIYIQDILSGTPEDIKFARQLSAYFVEPKGNEFYQISMAAGSYSTKEGYKLLKDIENYDQDKIIDGLEQDLKLIMDNIIYK